MSFKSQSISSHDESKASDSNDWCIGHAGLSSSDVSHSTAGGYVKVMQASTEGLMQVVDETPHFFQIQIHSGHTDL